MNTGDRDSHGRERSHRYRRCLGNGEKHGKKKMSNDVSSHGGRGNNDKNSDHTNTGILIKVYTITVAVNRVTFTVSSRMVSAKYKEEDNQLTGVPNFLTKLTVVAPLNKIAINMGNSSRQVADVLLSTGRTLRISLLILLESPLMKLD